MKGIALYRDGSKNAQPLNTSMAEAADPQGLGELSYADLLAFAREAPAKSARRRRITGIRRGRTHLAQISGVKIYTTANRDKRDEISELFVTTDREGTTTMGLLNSLSKTISVMLQYGIPAERISKMLRGQRYEPYGFVQSHPNIKYVTSISDFISKVIDIELREFSHVQVRRESDDLGEADPLSTAFTSDAAPSAKLHGERLYDGTTCPECGSSRMVQNGTCRVYLDCGATTCCS